MMRYSNNRARRLVAAVADFVQNCDNGTFYSVAAEIRSILDAVEAADFEALAYLYSKR